VLIFALAASSLNLVLGFGGMVSLGHAAFLGAGAYAAAICQQAGINEALLAFPAAMGIAGLFALVVGAISLRTRGVYFIMITLAFAQMAYYLFISARSWGGDDGLPLNGRMTWPASAWPTTRRCSMPQPDCWPSPCCSSAAWPKPASGAPCRPSAKTKRAWKHSATGLPLPPGRLRAGWRGCRPGRGTARQPDRPGQPQPAAMDAVRHPAGHGHHRRRRLSVRRRGRRGSTAPARGEPGRRHRALAHHSRPVLLAVVLFAPKGVAALFGNAMADALLDVRRLSRRFAAVDALKAVDFSVQAGRYMP
jgi:hypothetical protein